MEKDLCKKDGEAWRVLEFYSGIGGMVSSSLNPKPLLVIFFGVLIIELTL